MNGENMSGSDVWVEAAPRISKEKACVRVIYYIFH
jgi:hypothetical protein